MTTTATATARKSIKDMDMGELTHVYNEYIKEGKLNFKPIKKGSISKTVLIERIKTAAPKAAPAKEPKAKAAKAPKAAKKPAEPKAKRIGIAERVLEYMQKGKDYAFILKHIKEEFPKARTTEYSLDWYTWRYKKDGLI